MREPAQPFRSATDLPRGHSGPPSAVQVRLLRLDGGIEAVIGLILVTSPISGIFQALRLPQPASRPMVVVVGIMLILLLPLFWWLSSRTLPDMRLIAVGNLVSAAVLAGWILTTGHSNTTGHLFVLAVSGALVILGMMQLAASR